MATLTGCTPADLANGCILCQSDTMILAAMALVTCRLNNGASGDCSPATLMEDAKCFACESDHQMLAALLAILAQFAITSGAITGITDLLNDAKCFACADPKMIRAIILKETCDYINGISIVT